jgi:hypothetical protein
VPYGRGARSARSEQPFPRKNCQLDGALWQLCDEPPSACFASWVAAAGDKEIGERINKVIGRQAEANDSLKGAVNVADFNDEGKHGKGKETADRLTNPVVIFEGLDFGRTCRRPRLAGRSRRILMRHFATESGKSKGQFYTSSEVSRDGPGDLPGQGDVGHADLRWLEARAAAAPAAPTVLGGVTRDWAEEQLEALNDWVEAEGLPRGVVSFDFADPKTGERRAVFDLLWLQGLQEELSQPLAAPLHEGRRWWP